jgi:hypothetical protein
LEGGYHTSLHLSRKESVFLFGRDNSVLSAKRNTNEILLLLLQLVMENAITGIAEAYGISQSAL